MDKDNYFKSFTLAPYRFIVANRNTLTPLVWEFESTVKEGDLILGNNNQIILRDPFVIGKELNHYLKDKPIIPDGITNVKYNKLEKWINKL